MLRILGQFEVCLTLLLVVAGCGYDDAADLHSSSASDIAESETREPPLRIGSFNMSLFDAESVSDASTQIFAKIIARFDVVAIQELRSMNQRDLAKLVSAVNDLGYDYGFVLGPRLKAAGDDEQYAYVFDNRRVAVDRDWVYTFKDKADILRREPLVTRFKTLSDQVSEPFSFLLVNLHTDPDRAEDELAFLDELFLIVQQNGSEEDDVIVVGDLNSSPKQLQRLRLPGYLQWVVHESTTNTRRTRAYDNMVVDRRFTQEFTGKSGVFDFRDAFGLTLEQALEISDHLPVWAEFSPKEHRGRVNVATRVR